MPFAAAAGEAWASAPGAAEAAPGAAASAAGGGALLAVPPVERFQLGIDTSSTGTRFGCLGAAL